MHEGAEIDDAARGALLKGVRQQARQQKVLEVVDLLQHLLCIHIFHGEKYKDGQRG